MGDEGGVASREWLCHKWLPSSSVFEFIKELMVVISEWLGDLIGWQAGVTPSLPTNQVTNGVFFKNEKMK
jgi:hypothetical protein